MQLRDHGETRQSLQIFIVKAKTEIAALDLVEDFMKPYGDSQVWDYYEFGWGDLHKFERPTKAMVKQMQEMKERNQVAIGELKETVKNYLTTNEEDFMTGFYLRKLGDLIDKRYCFDSHVFNLESYEAFDIPADLLTGGYILVVVDIHN